MRKFLLTLTPALITSAPILSALACSSGVDEKKQQEDWEKRDQHATEINLNEVEGIDGFFERFNGVYNLFMPELATKLLAKLVPSKSITIPKNPDTQPAITEASYRKFVDYAHKINTSAVSLKISHGETSQVFKMDKFREHILAFKKELKHDNYRQVTSQKKALDRVMKMFWDGNDRIPITNMIAIAGHALGLNFALNFVNFAALPGDTGQHFFNVLDALHEFSKEITASKVWQSWSKGKKYRLVSSKSELSNNFANFTKAVQDMWKNITIKDWNSVLNDQKQTWKQGEEKTGFEEEKWIKTIKQAISEFLKWEVERFEKIGLKINLQTQVSYQKSDQNGQKVDSKEPTKDQDKQQNRHQFKVRITTVDPYKPQKTETVLYENTLSLGDDFQVVETNKKPTTFLADPVSDKKVFKELGVYEIDKDGAYGRDLAVLKAVFDDPSALAYPKDLAGLNNFEAQLMFNIVKIYSEAD